MAMLLQDLIILPSQAKGQLLYGPENDALFTHDIVKASDKQYLYFGKLVAAAILHGYPTPPLCLGLCAYIIGKMFLYFENFISEYKLLKIMLCTLFYL